MHLQLDPETAATVRFAARVMGIDPAKVIARLVREWSRVEVPENHVATPADLPGADEAAIFGRYMNHRVDGVLHPDRTITVTSGSLAGQNFGSPSAAAAAVVQSVNPARTNVHVNGWRFWRLASNGRAIDGLR